ncbi:hypothetical protein [Pyrobaculum sp.]|uniref:hypothetical protein n=1 Tax=Pyrobaculum sp. TaxID=2004705 RepID=UPI003D0C1C1A
MSVEESKKMLDLFSLMVFVSFPTLWLVSLTPQVVADLSKGRLSAQTVEGLFSILFTYVGGLFLYRVIVSRLWR